MGLLAVIYLLRMVALWKRKALFLWKYVITVTKHCCIYSCSKTELYGHTSFLNRWKSEYCESINLKTYKHNSRKDRRLLYGDNRICYLVSAAFFVPFSLNFWEGCQLCDRAALLLSIYYSVYSDSVACFVLKMLVSALVSLVFKSLVCTSRKSFSRKQWHFIPSHQCWVPSRS